MPNKYIFKNMNTGELRSEVARHAFTAIHKALFLERDKDLLGVAFKLIEIRRVRKLGNGDYEETGRVFKAEQQ